MTRPFTVMAYRGLDCIDFRRVQRPRTVLTASDTYIVDRNATRVIVVADGVPGHAAEWNATGGWRVNDPRLADVLSADFER